jgi:hypothetical protein
MRNWRNEIENYWLIDYDGEMPYGLFYVPTESQVILEGGENGQDNTISQMIAAGVKIVKEEEFYRFIRRNLSPEYKLYYEELDRENRQKREERNSLD